MTRFVVVPQWQGSPAARAMLLAAGAEAIAGDLPRAKTVVVEVPFEAGEAQGTGVRRFSAIARVHEAVADALAAGGVDASHPTGREPAIVVGGDCGVAVPAIAHAAAAHEGLAVVWFDAHADLHSPATSPSGAFAGMALRAVIDDLPSPSAGATPGAPHGAVPPERVFLAGARELDDAEADLLDGGAGTPRHLAPADLDDPTALVDAVAASGATALYVHVDLDVLDPAVISGVSLPVPFGLTLEQLVATVAALRERLPLVGASIAGFAPAAPAAAVDDLGTILRVVGALA